MATPSRIWVLPPEISDHSVHWRIPRDWPPDGVRLEVDWILNADPSSAPTMIGGPI